MTDSSDDRKSEHEQIQVMAEGSRKQLAMYMHQECHFPNEPVCGCNDDDELIRLRFLAGGSFYKNSSGEILFIPMNDDEISATIWPPRWPPKHTREDFIGNAS